MVAGTFHDGLGAGIADRKALADPAGDIHFAARGTVETSVTGNGVLFRLEGCARGRADGHPAATQAFADIVVGLPLQANVDAAGEERAEALAGGALELDVHGRIWQTLCAVLGGNPSAEHRTDGPVGIGNRVFEADFLFPVDGRLRGLDDFLIAHGGQFVQRTADPATGPLFAEEQTGQVNE